MSTNSIIAVKTDAGYKSIYCHWDGYFDYMYPMLDTWYSSQERAEALVNLGDASFIAKRLTPSQDSNHSFEHPEEDVSVFYHRDRGERWEQTAPQVFTKTTVVNDFYYAYIFEDGQWNAYKNGRKIIVRVD